MSDRNKNRWNDNRDNNDRDQDRNRNWNKDSRRNTSMHQGNWNESGRSQNENYGLGDTSQGSANYGHEDDGSGARYYGTGSYGGYFGGGNEHGDDNSRRHQDRRGYEGRSQNFEDKNLNYGRRGGGKNEGRSDNYERGPRYGNSNIHGKSYEGGNYGRHSENRGGAGHQSDYENYGRGSNANRDSRYDAGSSSEWNKDRDWWDKTTDEVSSWFGDEDADRRRQMDQRYGEHHGKGPKGYTRSDEKIKDDVEEKLYHDSFVDASEIEVSVSEGEVTLSGTVDNKQTKRRAEDCAESISGVKDVSNHLKIKRQENYGSTAAYSSGIAGNVGNVTGNLSESEQKLDQSKDLNRTTNK